MTPKVIRLTVAHDPFTDNPTEFDGWKIYTFGNNRIITDCQRDDFYDEDEIDPQIAEKIRDGLAFGIQYRSHGQSLYRLSHELTDGIMIWEDDEDSIGAKTVEEREKDAKAFLETYTAWANGECYFLRVERIKSVAPDFVPEDKGFNGAFWEEIDSVGGYIGSEFLNERVKEIKAKYPDHEFVLIGDCRWVVE